MSIIRYYISMGYFVLLALSTQAQTENADIHKGNQLYKKGEYDKALPEYQKVLGQNAKNPVANFNMGNAQFRTKSYEEAEKAFDAAISTATVDSLKQKAFYNKGVALSQQKKLAESIDAYKKALQLNPTDEDTRFNLQKALSEWKKQNQPKEQEKKQQEQKKEQQQQKQQPNPRESKLDKKKIEQYLKSLQQKEQEVQQKMQQNRARSVTQPQKDW